ncbi:MAG: hypothetical protein ACAH59_07385 [Pseudobdellovibrionaceae bacterium]
MPIGRFSQMILISVGLLVAALLGARAHAEDRFDVIAQLKHWQARTSFRQDLPEREKDQRLQLISRLIFQVERKYQENSLRDFFSVTLKEMIKTDQMTANQSFLSQELFLLSLKESYETLLENKEDPLVFIESFTEFSSVTNPVSADEFAETRSYFDGKNVLAAKTMSLEEVSEILEEKEKALPEIERKWFDLKTPLPQEFTPIEQPRTFSQHFQNPVI